MQLHRTPPPLPLVRPAAAPPAPAARVAQDFEALIAASLLRAASAARLGDDNLGSSAGSDELRDLVQCQQAEMIARAAPLGVARLLAPPR